MKKLIILTTLGLFIACSSTRINRSPQNKKEFHTLYMIKKIKKEKSFFIIYAERNDSTFKIVSKANLSDLIDCEKIKKGNSYNLVLEKIFPSDSLFGIPVSPNLGIKGYSIDNGQVIMLEEKSHNKIYSALNLNGLCVEK